ncbi:MAG: hypothetical protein ACLPH3_08295 [Terracidiphilus sp.]
MKDEMLDRILATEEELVPSSGFAASVMDRIREEAAVPPPIPFPWKRAIPGIALAIGVFGWGAVELTRQAVSIAHTAPSISLHIPDSLQRPIEGIGWAAIALVVSLASWALSRFMTGDSQLL